MKIKYNFEDGSYNYKSRKQNKKIRSYLVTERFLMAMIKVLASNIIITKRSLANMKRFVNVIDREYYSQEVNFEAMFIVIDMLIDTRLFSNKPIDVNTIEFKVETLLSEPYEEVRDNLIIPTIELAKTEISESELDFINSSIDYNLKYGKVYTRKDDLIECANEISNCSYTDFHNVFKNFRGLITELYNFFKTTDEISEMNSIVHTNDESFISYLKETWEAIKNPASALQTGWQALNSALGPRGGFLNKNLYVFFANTNSFKSAFLLHISRMIAEYNVERIMKLAKDMGKTPTVLHLSFENDDDEDNERYYKTTIKKDIGRCNSFRELKETWDQVYGDETRHLDISFLHAESQSMDVEAIDNLIETLSEEGYWVIGAVIDYIEMIRANAEDRMKDIRLQYKGIAEALLNLAKSRCIPVITAHQLNRSGSSVLTNAKSQGQSDAVALMSDEYVGESYAIPKTASYTAFIDIEEHDGEKYFLYKRGKSRYRRFGKEYFVMKIRDGIIIDDDFYLDHPLSYDRIPNSPNSMTENPQATVGARGTIDLRDKKPSVKKNTETIIGNDKESQKPKVDETSKTLVDTVVEWDHWWDFLTMFEPEQLTYDTGYADIQSLTKEGLSIDGFDYVGF